MTKYLLRIMDSCVESIDEICSEVGEYVTGALVLVGEVLLDLLVHFVIIVTMPVWYLPYKIYRKRGKDYGQKKQKKTSQYRHR